MKNMTLLFWLSILLTCSFATAHAQSPLYYLCGPDEDGCPIGYEQYCNCIPYNQQKQMKPYCLDFDNMTCEPLYEVSNCNPDHIYQDQGSCLATIFQSEPVPPCRIVNESFCEENRVAVCDASGNPDSCKKLSGNK